VAYLWTFWRVLTASVVLSAGVLVACSAHAATVGYLFLAAVPVADQSVEVRQQGMRTALEAVLIKVTGLGDAASRPQTQALLANAAPLVDQYRYISRPGANGVKKLYLAVQFDEQAVQQGLRKYSVQAWGQERPQVLVVLAGKALKQSFLLGEKNAGKDVAAARQAIKAMAARRGLPVKLPVLDAFDSANVAFADVWAGNYDPLPGVARRYQSNVVLVGQALTKNGSVWQVRWTLLEQGQSVDTWLSPQGTLAKAAGSGVQGLTDRLVARFFAAPALNVPSQAIAPIAAPTAANGDLIVDVLGVSSLQAYADVVTYLQGLSLVTQLNVVTVDGDRLRCGLQLQGSPRQLQQAIALTRQLTPLPAGADAALVYRVAE